MQGLVTLREFEFSQISERRSEDLRQAFVRLNELRLHVTIKYGSSTEVEESHQALRTDSVLKQSTGNKDGHFEVETTPPFVRDLAPSSQLKGASGQA